MADPDALGGLDHFIDVYAAAVAVRELRLSSDPAVPQVLRQAAERVEAAEFDLREAVDLALELEEAGARQLVGLVPEVGSLEEQALQERPRPLWAAYEEVEASLAELLATVNGLAPLPDESTVYHAALDQVGVALGAARWQHIAAADFSREGMPVRVVDVAPEPSRPTPASPIAGDDGGDDLRRQEEELALLREEAAWREGPELDEP